MVHFGHFLSRKVGPHFTELRPTNRSRNHPRRTPEWPWEVIQRNQLHSCASTYGAIPTVGDERRLRTTTLWASCGLDCARHNGGGRLSIKEVYWQETRAQEVRRGTVLCLGTSFCLLSCPLGEPKVLGGWVPSFPLPCFPFTLSHALSNRT